MHHKDPLIWTESRYLLSSVSSAQDQRGWATRWAAPGAFVLESVLLFFLQSFSLWFYLLDALTTQLLSCTHSFTAADGWGVFSNDPAEVSLLVWEVQNRHIIFVRSWAPSTVKFNANHLCIPVSILKVSLCCNQKLAMFYGAYLVCVFLT